MNTYEQMLLDDESALLVGITALIRNCIEGDESAKKELAEVEKVINLDYEISCDATFTPSTNVLQTSRTFTSIKDFVNAEDEEEGYSYEFEDTYDCVWDDDMQYGNYQLEKWSHRISVDINGLTDNASDEAKAKYDEIILEKIKEGEQKHAEAVVERLRKQLEEAEAQLKN